MSQALFITAMGMTIVYTVLALIYGSIRILGLFESKLPALAAGSAAGTPAAPASDHSDSAMTPEEEAAVHAAIAHHTGRAPETFQTRISPEKKES